LREEVEAGGLRNEHQYQIVPSINAHVVLGHAGSGSERPTGRLLQVPAVGTATGEPCTRAEDPAGRLLQTQHTAAPQQGNARARTKNTARRLLQAH